MREISLTRPFILASASPRRAELLRQIGLPFRVLPSDYHEPPPAPAEDVAAYIGQASREKALAVARTLPPEPVLILGADTLVLAPIEDDAAAPRLHDRPVAVMGKPRDAADAFRMLRALSGRVHTVISAFSVLCHPEDECLTETVETQVRFRELRDEEIRDYIDTGEPLDKAGAYGIQGRGAVLVERIDGDYNTVVGLPLARLWEVLAPWRDNL
ncbi:MAG: Maf family protein [Armatimonadota bacterium]